ncbi:hypothetical protein FRC12_014308 [Ceratobasidium sp. 428]|nr:hypothetical protein FRC12_014308 [Ceratobasidium sp. 428]
MSASHFQPQNACLRTLQIPELYQMIFSLIEKRHHVKLLHTSRSAFALMLPVIWEEVDFRDILLLIPGVTVTLGEPSSSTAPEYIFNLPPVIDLSRVKVYSPAVKTLTTTCPYTVNIPHKALKSMTQAGLRPMLPNLQRLLINICSIVRREHFTWIPLVLHSGLLSLEMYMLMGGYAENVHEKHAWLDRDICFGLIDQLSRTCPQLETLRLFPREHVKYSQKVKRTSISIRVIDLIDQISSFKSGKSVTRWRVPFQILGGFTHLRSLTFSGTMVRQPLFVALGRLPRLETLSLRADESQFQVDDENSANIPEDSFPSLQHLDLYQLNEYAISRICNIAPLFRHLISVSIIFKGKPSYFGTHFSDRINRSEVAVACLGVNSPHVERLTILPYGFCLSEFTLSWSTIEKFRRMPLRYLRAGVIKLGPNDSLSFDFGAPQIDRSPRWEDFLTAVPQLEELRMDSKHVSLDELRLLGSYLPRLRLLVFWQVDLRQAVPPPETSNAAQPVTLRSWSYFGANIIGQFRYSFWVACIPSVESTICNAARFVY